MKEKEEKVVEIFDLGSELEKSKPYVDKFNRAKNFNKERQEAYAENMAFYQGNQFLLSRYKSKQPWVINMNTPYATVAIDNRISSMMANDYIGELLPLSEEDIENVSKLNSAYVKEWKRMYIDDIVKTSIKKGAVVREYYCHIVVNKDKVVGGSKHKRLGALEGYGIEPSCIYIDPDARNLRDGNFMFVSGRIAKDKAIEEYPKLKDFNFSTDSYTPADRGEVYKENDYTTEQNNILTVLTYYGKVAGKIKRVKLIANIIVEESTIDIDCFPIVQFRWREAAQSCYGLSLMDEVLSLQKAVNSIESAITNTAIAYAAPSMIVKKGCGIDPKVVARSAGAPGVVYAAEGNISEAMKPVVVPQISADIIAIKTNYQEQIDKITGNTNAFLGTLGSAGNTSGGSKMAVERAKIIELDVINSIKKYVEQITEVIVKYIISIYGGEIITSYEGKDGKGKPIFSDTQLPEKDVLKKLQYSYYIELESKTPYSKERQKEALLEMFQIERQYDTPIKTITISDLIKNSDLENKEEIIDRYTELAYQDAETKSATITQLYNQATQLGIDGQLIQDAITEIIQGVKETPAVDELMKQMEQLFAQQMQQAQAAQDEADKAMQGQMTPEMMNKASNQGQQINASPEAISQAQQMLQQGQM